MNDMLEIEEELVKIGSFFIEKHEFVFNTELKEPSNAIDRSEMVLALMENEL
jgi:hypothetical protein